MRRSHAYVKISASGPESSCFMSRSLVSLVRLGEFYLSLCVSIPHKKCKVGINAEHRSKGWRDSEMKMRPQNSCPYGCACWNYLHQKITSISHRKRLADIENKLMVTKGEERWGKG